MDLKGRLQRLKTLEGSNRLRENEWQNREIPPLLLEQAFEKTGSFTLKRTLSVRIAEPPHPVFSEILAALVPCLAGIDSRLKVEDLIFFDIETTGLSGGAGTAAFLAGFGRFGGGNYRDLKVEQYLLLDYPGEADFLRQITAALDDGEETPVIVSYNGKSFDSQIIKNRCLVNGMPPPLFCRHADLLHTARCLWKKILPSCSQSAVEKNILNMERRGDTDGARAPDIWFSFLKTNDASELLGICRHNVLDIAGLASIFSVLTHIAHAPEKIGERYSADTEALALRVRRFRLRHGVTRAEITELETRLLEKAAAGGATLAMFLLGKRLLQNKRYDEARSILENAAQKNSGAVSAAADRLLAVDSEWRMRDMELALYYAERTLARPNAGSTLIADTQKRRERLIRMKEIQRANLTLAL
ncbi:MAG: ribonuclease H-like domain-containing protein [Spirochaetaceae bacterium]|jgi:uncharacterized protein YprB with RNaseH-like and TPR domain|nr:ribonuclease H-like domain-containing protein [Spirochaetaceae bacterium]